MVEHTRAWFSSPRRAGPRSGAGGSASRGRCVKAARLRVRSRRGGRWWQALPTHLIGRCRIGKGHRFADRFRPPLAPPSRGKESSVPALRLRADSLPVGSICEETGSPATREALWSLGSQGVCGSLPDPLVSVCTTLRTCFRRLGPLIASWSERYPCASARTTSLYRKKPRGYPRKPNHSC